MGKVFPKDKESTKAARSKQKGGGRLRGALDARKEYVKPGALAHQLRFSRATSTKSCTDLGKKRILVLDSKKKKKNQTCNDVAALQTTTDAAAVDQRDPLPMLSPERINTHSMAGPLDFLRQSKMPRTPKTPQKDDWESDSRLESLPMDILVKILCHLHHDQLRAVFHVSQKIRKAVLLARQFHFNYTTPDRARQEMLRQKTPLPTEHWPFMSKGDGKGALVSSPHTPRAPRHGPRPPSRYKGDAEVRQITAVLFQESTFPKRCSVPPGLPKSICKSFASNLALFCEDELCQAVAQNKLR